MRRNRRFSWRSIDGDIFHDCVDIISTINVAHFFVLIDYLHDVVIGRIVGLIVGYNSFVVGVHRVVFRQNKILIVRKSFATFAIGVVVQIE